MVWGEKTCCVIVAIKIAESVRDGAGNSRRGLWELIVLPWCRLT